MLKNLQSRGDEFVTEETFSVIFDGEMQKDLLSLLNFYKTSHTSVSYEISDLPNPKYKESVSKFAQFTFLSKESLEKSVVKLFFSLHKDVPEGEELILALLNFYNEERLATIKIIIWLLNPSAFAAVKPEIIALCRATLKSLLSQGLIEKASFQLVNLSSISLPSTILKENRNEISFAWIHQNILEQKEMAKMVFELLFSDFVKLSVDDRSKILSELIKNNFGLNNFEKYNLDSETVILAREAFWFRQSAAIRILDLKGLISASVSSSNILSALNPLKPSALLNLFSSFKTELNHELTSPFKFSWSLLVGFLDSLEILDCNDIKQEYPRIASQCVDRGIFKIVLELLDANNFLLESASIKTSIKSLFKDVYTAFLTIFDSNNSMKHLPIITEGLIKIFSNENELCEEFWYVDSQFPGRSSVLKHWINRFPHDFISLIRLLGALSSGPTCSELVSDFLLKGFDHIYVERSSDRGNVIESYDLGSEIYNLTVEKTMEIHSCGIGLILESGCKGVMMSGGLNERPMVNWQIKISPFHFLLRILQISQDFSANYFILELFERLINDNEEEFVMKLYQHLEGSSTIFTQVKVNNLPLTLIDLLLFVFEQPNPNALIMSKCLNCLNNFRSVFDLNFFTIFMQISSNLMDGITNVLKRCAYDVEIDSITFDIFDSVIKFSDCLLNLGTKFAEERPEECSILLKSLKGTIFNFIIDHVGKWRFISQPHRIRLIAEVCRLILSLQEIDDRAPQGSYVSTTGRNFALLNAVISLINDINQEPETFKYGKLFIECGIDVSIYFQCLTKTIEFCDDGTLILIAEYFGSCHVSSADGCLKSPFTIIAEALTLDFMVLPVLLFFQYVFLNDRFALNVRISRESLEILSSAMCKWFKLESRDTLPKVRSAALAVLNNTACTRSDIFLFIFGQDEEAFINLFNEGIGRNVFDYETALLTGICSILWTSVSEFTLVINALKKKKLSESSGSTAPFVSKLIGLLSLEWSESQTPRALQILSSVFEVLAVELCYFNLFKTIPTELSAIKSGFEPEKFVKKVLLFQKEFPESFFTFIESFSIFSSSSLALQDETEFNRKILPSLVLVIDRLITTESPSNFLEMTCKVLNFGLLNSKDKKDCYTLLGHELYSTLVSKMVSLLAQSIEGDLNEETDGKIELVSTLGTLLGGIEDNFNWKSEELSNLFEMMGTVLNILRHFLVLQIRNQRKVTSYLKLMISTIKTISRGSTGTSVTSTQIAQSTVNSQLIHFIRREGVLKTIFSLIRNYRDKGSFILFISGLCSKFNFIIDELLSNELLETFIIDIDNIDSYDSHYKLCENNRTKSINNDFFLDFLKLLSIVRINFDSNCFVSEKICTILYSCNLQTKLRNFTKSGFDFELLKGVLPLLKLLANSLETPIEAPACEALLTNLTEPLLIILKKLLEVDCEKSPENMELISLLVSTLITFTFYSNSRNNFRKNLQHLLFPFDQSQQKRTTSQYASALHMIIIMGHGSETVENCRQILKFNCPEMLKPELDKLI